MNTVSMVVENRAGNQKKPYKLQGDWENQEHVVRYGLGDMAVLV